MSLIIAANLVDRIYMCADTRLSRAIEKDGTTTFERVHDNQLKIVPSDNFLSVGCVGSPALGAFLLKKIQQEVIKPGVHIRELRSELEARKNDLLAWTGDYLAAPPSVDYKYARCVLVFAGLDPAKRRKVNGKKLIELTKEYQESSQSEFENLFGGKPIEQFTQAEINRFAFEMQKRRQGLKHIVVEGMNALAGKPAEEIELKTPDQFIFALKINAQNYSNGQHDKIVQFDDFEWGTFAVYGAEFDPSMLPPTFFGNLDLNMNAGNPEQDLMWLVEEIHEKFSVETIGGSITNMVLHDGKIYSIAHHLRVMNSPTSPARTLYHTEHINGAIHHHHMGIVSKLIPFTESQKLAVSAELLVE